MKPVALDPPTVSDLADRQRQAAAMVAQRAVAERFDAAALAPTFGLIGAPFLAALAATMESRASRLDGLAGSHAGQSNATAAGAAGYHLADTAGAAGVAEVTP